MLKIQDLVDGCKIEEVVHAASQTCRWRGRFRWITLAEHLCNVHDIVMQNKDHTISQLRLALIHDICEVLGFGDVISPLKSFVTIIHDDQESTLREFECKMTKKLMNKLFLKKYKAGQYEKDKKIIKEADTFALEQERLYNDGLKQKTVEGWNQDRAYQEFFDRFDIVAFV